jgi:hypothetical protein
VEFGAVLPQSGIRFVNIYSSAVRFNGFFLGGYPTRDDGRINPKYFGLSLSPLSPPHEVGTVRLVGIV